MFLEVLNLAIHLGINIIFEDLAQLILDGKISIDFLLKYYELYKDISEIKLAAVSYISNQTAQFDSLPEWIKQVLKRFEIKTLPKTNKNTLFFTIKPMEPKTIDNSRLADMLVTSEYRTYGAICLSKGKPSFIKDTAVDEAIAAGMKVTTYVEGDTLHHIICNDPKFPYLGLIVEQLPCCYEIPQDLSDPRINAIQKKAYRTSGEFLVFLPPTYYKDFVVTSDYTLAPKVNAVVILH